MEKMQKVSKLMQTRKACALCSYMYAVSPKPFDHATISRDGQFLHMLLFDMKFALFLTFVKKRPELNAYASPYGAINQK